MLPFSEIIINGHNRILVTWDENLQSFFKMLPFTAENVQTYPVQKLPLLTFLRDAWSGDVCRYSSFHNISIRPIPRGVQHG